MSHLFSHGPLLSRPVVPVGHINWPSKRLVLKPSEQFMLFRSKRCLLPGSLLLTKDGAGRHLVIIHRRRRGSPGAGQRERAALLSGALLKPSCLPIQLLIFSFTRVPLLCLFVTVPPVARLPGRSGTHTCTPDSCFWLARGYYR